MATKKTVRRAAVRTVKRGAGRVAAAESGASAILSKLKARAEEARDAAEERAKHLAQVAEKAAKGIDVKSIRQRFKLTPARFAALIGVSVAAVKLWERSRRPENRAAAFISKARKKGRKLLS